MAVNRGINDVEHFNSIGPLARLSSTSSTTSSSTGVSSITSSTSPISTASLNSDSSNITSSEVATIATTSSNKTTTFILTAQATLNLSTTSTTSPGLSTSTRLSIADSVDSATSLPKVDDGSINRSGYIAGLAVLGTLLLLALLALAFLLLRIRRRHRDTNAELLPGFEEKTPLDPSLDNLEHTVVALETQLHAKDIELRESQAALLQIGRRISAINLPDRKIQDRFFQLYINIGNWVTTHLEDTPPLDLLPSDIILTLGKSQPSYESLLKSPETAIFVLQGLVADVLAQAFTSGQLLGIEAYWELKQAINVKASASDANEWRAMTMRLLEKTPGYHNDRIDAIEVIRKKIEHVTSNFVRAGPLETRLAELDQIVDAAASLAMDVAKQRGLFKFEPPPSHFFDSNTMEEVSPNANKDGLEGKTIRAVVFPAVTKWGNEAGVGYERSTTILKAQVLV